jgi:peroxiredoxin
MKARLADFGVEVIGVSKDSAVEAASHRVRDGLSLQLLSDSDLSVTRQFGLEHHKALEFSTVRFSIAGIPMALVPSIRTMAIPTSILVDEEGVIRWIDQSEDYRLRSDEGTVLAAIERAFPRQALAAVSV